MTLKSIERIGGTGMPDRPVYCIL